MFGGVGVGKRAKGLAVARWRADTFSSAPVLGKRSSSRYFRSAFGAVVFPPLPTHVAPRVYSEATHPSQRRRGRVRNVTVSPSHVLRPLTRSTPVILSLTMQIAATSPSAVPFYPFPSPCVRSPSHHSPAASPWRGQRVSSQSRPRGPRRPLPV